MATTNENTDVLPVQTPFSDLPDPIEYHFTTHQKKVSIVEPTEDETDFQKVKRLLRERRDALPEGLEREEIHHQYHQFVVLEQMMNSSPQIAILYYSWMGAPINAKRYFSCNNYGNFLPRFAQLKRGVMKFRISPGIANKRKALNALATLLKDYECQRHHFDGDFIDDVGDVVNWIDTFEPLCYRYRQVDGIDAFFVELAIFLLRKAQSRLQDPLPPPSELPPLRVEESAACVASDGPKIVAQADVENSVVKEENTTFVDQRETVTDEGFVTSQITPSLANLTMDEDEWHVRNVMAKPIPFYSGEWTTSQKPNDFIRFDVVGDLLKGPHFNLVSTFTYFRGHPEIRVQLNGTKFHAGRLLVCFIPRFSGSDYNDTLYYADQLLAAPHCVLDASCSNSGVISLPFVHQDSYFNSVIKRPNQSLGSLFITVLNVLRAGKATASVSYTCWVSFKDCELHQPCQAHTPVFPKTSKLMAQAGVEGLLKSAIPLVTDLVAPGMGTAASAAVDLVGNMDKPTDPIEITRIVPNVVTGLSVGSGIDRSSRLCLYPGTYSIPAADMISTTENDMNLLCLAKIPTRLFVGTWTTSNPAKYTICTLPMGPGDAQDFIEEKNTKPPVDIYGTTMLSYVSRAFKFWRGGLRVKVQIIASAMHTGRLLIAYAPGQQGLSFDTASYVNTYIMDLQERHEVEFVVPYMAEKPWLRCDHLKPVSTNKQGVQANLDEAVGVLGIFVLNKLSCPDSADATVDINVFIAASDDFELACPADFTGCMGAGRPPPGSAAPPPPPMQMIAQAEPTWENALAFMEDQYSRYTPQPILQAQALAAEANVSSRTDEGVVMMSKGGSMLRRSAEDTMSENAMDMKTVLRRYCPVFDFQPNQAVASALMAFNNTPCLSSVNICFGNDEKKRLYQNRTLLSHFGELFTFWSGELRYKIMFTGNIGSGTRIAIYHVPQCTNLAKANIYNMLALNRSMRVFNLALQNYGTALFDGYIQRSIEFEVPMYTPYTQLQTQMFNSFKTSMHATGDIFIFLDGEHESQWGMKIYQSGGDTFRYNYLRAPPYLTFRAGIESGRLINQDANALYAGMMTVDNLCNPPADGTTCCSEDEEKKDGNGFAKISQTKIFAQGLCQPRKPGNGEVEMVQVVRSDALPLDSIDAEVERTLHVEVQAGQDDEDEDDEEYQDIPTSSGFSRLTSAVQSAFKPTVVTKVETTCDSVTKMTDSMNKLTTNVDGILEGIVSQLKNLIGDIPQNAITLIADSSAIINALYTWLNTTNIFFKISALTSLVRTLIGPVWTEMAQYARSMISSLIQTRYGSSEGNELPKAQGDITEIFPFITMLLTAIAGVFVFKKCGSSKEALKETSGFAERLKAFNFGITACKNLGYVWEQTKQMCEATTVFIAKWISPQLYSQMKLERGMDEVEEFCNFAYTYKDTWKKHYATSFTFRRLLYKMYDRSLCYAEMVPLAKLGIGAALVKDCIRHLTVMRNEAKEYEETLQVRIDPYCVCMTGKTNIGKSGVITELMHDTMTQLGHANHNRWCAINPSETFFTEGYDNQTCVYIDDFSAFTSEEQYKNFFNLKSNTQYPLNMAFKKGKKFTSSFIAMTTNVSHPQPPTLPEKAALWRRRDLLIEADFVSEAVQDQILNGTMQRPTDHSHARYRILSPTNPNSPPLTTWMTLPALKVYVAECAGRYHESQERKVINDLRTFGYELPETLAQGKARPFKPEAYYPDPSLCLDHETLDALVRQEDGTYVCTDEEQMEDWQAALNCCGTAVVYSKLDQYWIPESEKTMKFKITSVIGKMKEWLKNAIQTLTDKFPILKSKAAWAVAITGAVCAMSYFVNPRSVKQACACMALKAMAYRCSLCGKWPELKDVPRSLCSWLKEEWSKVYGALAYIGGKVTSLAEERLVAECAAETPTQVIMLGTKIAAQSMGPYSGFDGRVAPRSVIAAHAGDRDAVQVTENRVYPYMYRIRQPLNSMCCYAIGGKKVIVPSHFFDGLLEGQTFEVKYTAEWTEFVYEPKEIIIIPGRDIAIIDLGARFPSRKDNVKHFIKEADLPFVNDSYAHLTTLRKDGHFYDARSKVTAKGTIRYDSIDHSREILNCETWEYHLVCKAGDCGSVLVTHNPQIQGGKIIGLHIAGTNGDYGLGYSTVVTQEMLRKHCTESVGTPLPTDMKEGNFVVVPQGHLSRHGIAGDGGMFLPTKSNIFPSPIYDEVFAHETEPAVLVSRDCRLDVTPTYPLSKGIAKYAKVVKPFDPDTLSQIEESLIQEVCNYKTSRDITIPLTESEVIYGIDGVEFYDKMNMKSAPGYPWTKTKPKYDKDQHLQEAGKAYLFDAEARCIKDKKLRQAFEHRDAQARQGHRVLSIWTDCLKDEKRAIEKIREGKTRVFTIPPVDFSLLARKYLLDFSSTVKANMSQSFSKVGITPESLHWNELYYSLKTHSPYCIAGDFAAFDGTIPPELIQLARNVVKGFYKYHKIPNEEEVGLALDVIFDELTHTVQLAKSELYTTHEGNPSGNPITDILNSIVNFAYMSYAYLKLARMNAPELATMYHFRQSVKLAVYGDDNLLSVKANIIEWYNQVTISNELANYNITYTDDTKHGTTAWKDLDDCTFLKRGFGHHEKLPVIVPLMAQRTCQELVNWVRKCPDPESQLIEQVNNALEWQYFYGQEQFLKWRDQVSTALVRRDISGTLFTYRDLDYRYRQNCGFV